MGLDLLKLMIEAACNTGSISDKDKEKLNRKAEELGVSKSDLDFLINAELEKVRSAARFKEVKQNNASGFTTEDNEQSSGFVTNDNESSSQPSDSNSFTEVTDLGEQGAMSLVQKAKYQGKWVMVKRINPEFRDDKRYRELFFKEFENTYHLDHPNIVRIYGKGEDEDGAFYYMEYVDGQTLSKLIKQNGGITNEKTLRKILLQILEAMAYVHIKQIYHRDLKPENILITNKGKNVKILDFGLAAADSFDDSLDKSGTPKYAAPEQKTNDGQIDQRTDIYAIGLILLEMITGQIRDRDTGKLRNPLYAKIIDKCLQQNPADRYQNCEDIANEIYQATNTVKTIPTWLENKIRDYASDGVITENERKVLELEAKTNRIDMETINLFVNVELENAKKRIDAEKEQQKAASKQPDKKLIVTGGILLGVALLVVLYFVVFAPLIRDLKADKKYVISTHLKLRSSRTYATDNNILDRAYLGEKVLVYNKANDWAEVKYNGKKGYMGHPDVYLVDKIQFYEMHALYDSLAQEILPAQAKHAVYRYCERRGYIGIMPEEIRKEIFNAGEDYSGEVWQINGLDEDSEYNCYVRGKFIGTDNYCYAVIITKQETDEQRLLVFEVNDDNESELLLDEPFPVSYDGITRAAKRRRYFQGEYNRYGSKQKTRLKYDAVLMGKNNDRYAKPLLYVYNGEYFERYYQP